MVSLLSNAHTRANDSRPNGSTMLVHLSVRPMNKKIDCIIPAAGESSRMGRWKPMLPFRNTTIVDHCVRNALRANCRVILVTGFRGEELHETFQNRSHIRLVTNKSYWRGMVSSIFEGIQQVESNRFFVVHADMPLIPPSVYTTLAKERSRYSIFPCFQGRPGHPVLVSSHLIPEILKHGKAPNIKSVLRQFPCKTIPVQSDGICIDIDTMEQYRQLLATYG